MLCTCFLFLPWAGRREAAVVLRLMLSAGFLDNMEREHEMDIEAGVFEEGLPLPARTECMGFFVDRLEVNKQVKRTHVDIDAFIR